MEYKFTEEELLAAAKRAGIKVSVGSKGEGAAFVSDDGTIRHKIEGRFIDTSAYYGPWKDPKNRTADDPKH